ncbi:MAG TPA: proprotein convertase P-domain-containing protein [Gemmataceae bacterium]|nr:proprotein convertase P-domain-containing protein [Gemmataceae bacterium]
MLSVVSTWLGRAAGRRPTSRAARRPLAVLPLEGRLVPTGLDPAVLISGLAQVGEGAYGTYTLNLTAVDPENDPVTGWRINWGDGSAVEPIAGNPSSVTHTFADGAGYVANVTAEAVFGLQPVAAKVSSAGSGGGVLPSFSRDVTPWVNGVAAGPDYNGDGFNDLYVGTGYGTASGVNVLDGKTGALLSDTPLVSYAADGLDFKEEAGLRFGPDGNLYVASDRAGKVFKYDTATGEVSTFVSGLFYPSALAFDAAGDLCVAHAGGGVIWKYDGTTGQRVGDVPFADLPCDTVMDMEFGPDGDLYVAPSSNNFDEKRVLKVDVDTGAITEFVAASAGLIRRPLALAFGPDGDLYVASEGTGLLAEAPRILQFDGATGALVGVLDHPEMMHGPYNMTFGADGDLYVTVSHDRYIYGGTQVRRFDGPLAATAATALPVTVLDAVMKTYSAVPKAAIPSDLRTYNWMINVTDPGTVLDVNVSVDITHPNVYDLAVYLVSPSGQPVELFADVGGSGDHFRNTVLDDEGGTPITAAAAPFTGTFRPEGRLSDFDGLAAQGTWTLRVRDGIKANKGTLNSWSVTITRGVGPAPLLAAGSPGAGAAPAPLTEARLQPIVAEAVRRWSRSGLTAAERQLLRTVTVQVGDLDGATLGQATGTTITIDGHAAGWGWFADPTPRSDAEFRRKGDQGELGRMDLLTAVVHELGHVLGRDHGDGAMAETLATGTRESIVPDARVGKVAATPAFGPGWLLSGGRARR